MENVWVVPFLVGYKIGDNYREMIEIIFTGMAITGAITSATITGMVLTEMIWIVIDALSYD